MAADFEEGLTYSWQGYSGEELLTFGGGIWGRVDLHLGAVLGGGLTYSRRGYSGDE